MHAVLTGADLRPTRASGVGCRTSRYWRGTACGSSAIASPRSPPKHARRPRKPRSLVDVEYEDAARCPRAEDALADDAPILHPDSAAYTFLAERGPRRSFAHPNIQGQGIVSNGSDDERQAAFANALPRLRAHVHDAAHAPGLHRAARVPGLDRRRRYACTSSPRTSRRSTCAISWRRRSASEQGRGRRPQRVHRRRLRRQGPVARRVHLLLPGAERPAGRSRR